MRANGIDYTEKGEIVRGSRWPPFAGAVTVTVILEGGWPIGAELWDWEMRFSRRRLGAAPDLAIDPDTVTRNDLIDALLFRIIATPAQTATLPGGDAMFNVDIWSDDAGGDGVSIADATQGFARVRSIAGQG